MKYKNIYTINIRSGESDQSDLKECAEFREDNSISDFV
jgi:hypothetical protein